MKDMTNGTPAKVIMSFAIPLMLGSIFQQFYNIADSKIVSSFVGTAALAAVGATAVISNVMIGFLNGLTQGFAILIAHSFGAGDYRRMRENIAGTVLLSMGTAAVLTFGGLFWIRDILLALHTPDDIFETAVSYVSVILYGILFSALYNMTANILRAVGDSRTPVVCLLAAICLNIGLDLLFVRVFSWGVEGAAVATVLSQAVSALLCLAILLLRFREILPRRESWAFRGALYRELFASGLAMGLMSCIVNVGTVVLQGAINHLGTAIVTAHTAARRLFEIMTVTLVTIGNTMTTFTSQNMGAGKPDRVRQGVKQSIVISVGITTGLVILCYTAGRPILSWITSTGDAEIVNSAVMYSRISILFFYVLGPLFILRCTLQGMGRRVAPICSSVMEMVIKVLSARFLVPAFGYIGVAFTEPISWTAMTLLLAMAYFAVCPDKRDRTRIQKEETEEIG